MTGHWEYKRYDGRAIEFKNEDEMKDFVLDNNFLDDVDYERWVNDNFTPARILWMLNDALEDYPGSAAEIVSNEIYDEFLDDMVYRHVATEGEDFEICDAVFKWVEDEEDD